MTAYKIIVDESSRYYANVRLDTAACAVHVQLCRRFLWKDGRPQPRLMAAYTYVDVPMHCVLDGVHEILRRMES